MTDGVFGAPFPNTFNVDGSVGVEDACIASCVPRATFQVTRRWNQLDFGVRRTFRLSTTQVMLRARIIRLGAQLRF